MVVPPAAAWLYAALVVGLVGADHGGYRATTWGWVGLFTFGLAAIAFVTREHVSFGLREFVFVGGLACFTAWVAISNLWTSSMTSTMLEVERDLGYTGIALAGVLLTRRGSSAHLLGGVFTAMTVLCGYALATRLLPDRFGGFAPTVYAYRLSTPIGYWNGLGIFAAMGMLLALGFAARGERLWTRVLAGAALPVISLAMFFTFSRGAWAGLILGIACALAVDPRRLQLIAVGAPIAIWPALAIFMARRKHGLTDIHSTFVLATRDGHSLFKLLPLFVLGAAATALVAALTDRRVQVPALVRASFAAVVLAVVVAGAGYVWASYGSPWHLAQRGWDQFKSPAGHAGPGTRNDITQRLFSLRSNGRIDLWRASLDSFDAKPLTGNGGGTFWQLWLRTRRLEGVTREPHSLYLGVLGEDGLPGLLFLGAGLIVPLAAAYRRRVGTLAAPALGAYVAWLAHSGIDWDWSLMAVGAAGLLIGVALLAPGERPPPGGMRSGAVVAATALAGLALVGLLGNRALGDAQKQVAAGHRSAALSAVHRAATLAPWSSQPDIIRGSIYLLAGNKRLARSYFRSALDKDRQTWFLWNELGLLSTGEERTKYLAEAHRLNRYLGPE